MTYVLQVINVIVGLLSLAGVIYIIGYWKGTIDEWKKLHEAEHAKYCLSEMFLQCNTMWKIVVVDALHQRPDLASHSSPFKLKKEAEDLIPDEMKRQLGKIAGNHANLEDLASGWLVVKALGFDPIERMAAESKLSLQETVAVLSTYLDECTDHH